MEEALRFFRAFEVWIYLLLGLGGLIYIRKFVQAWQELREAAFGLEREHAQNRLNQSASVLVLLLSVAVIEFMVVSFLAPTVPGAIPLHTPTLDLLATPTTTLPPGDIQAGAEVPLFTPAPAGGPLNTSNCLPGEIEITFPAEGQEVNGVIDVLGTADIANFGFYKMEMKRPDESVWLTIQAGNSVVNDNSLGQWDTRRLPPGEYQLSLVVVDNQAQASPPCIIQLRVILSPEETLVP